MKAHKKGTFRKKIPPYNGAILPRLDFFQLCHYSKNKILYVLADIGWGKTIAIRDWVLTEEASCFWITLKTTDNDWRYLEPRLIDALSFLTTSEDAENDPSQSRCILVLDDFYKLSSPETLAQLSAFIGNTPPTLQFVILSRKIVPEAMISFLVRRQLFQLTEESLRLSLEETREYLGLLGYAVSQEDAVELRALSDGWPIALNSMFLEIQQNGGHLLRRNQYLYSHKILNTMLEQEIFNPLSTRQKKLLLLLSFYEQFTLQDAEQLTGMPDTEALLHSLFQTNSFIRVSRGNCYHFQSRIYEFLSALREKRLSPTEMDTACKRAGNAYEAQEMLLKALDTYFKRNLYNDGIRVLKKLFKKHPATRDYYKIEPYLLQLPEAFIMKEPLLASGLSMVHAVNYRPDASRYWYQVLIGMRKSLSPSAQKREQLEFIIVQTNIANPIIYDDKNLIRHIWNGALLSKNTQLSFYELTVTGNQPRILAGSRDFSNWTCHARLLKRLLSKPMEVILGAATGAVIDTGMAETYYQYNDLNNSMIEVSKATAKSLLSNSFDILFVDRSLSAQILHAKGQMNEARTLLKQFEKELIHNQSLDLFDNFKAFSALQDLLEGKNEKALKWAANTPDENLGYRVLDRYLYLIKIRVYLCCGYLNQALPLIEILQNYAIDYRRQYNIIETTILKAICFDKMGEAELAEETMQKAIALGEPYHFIRIFADEGGGSYNILNRLQKDQRVRNTPFYLEILETARSFAKKYPEYYKNHKTTDTVLLTKAETTVLKQIATGKTNAEISEYLGVSVATTKTHINRIYSKLEVRNRTQALLKAEEQHIL